MLFKFGFGIGFLLWSIAGLFGVAIPSPLIYVLVGLGAIGLLANL
jgi:hypothetical protein